MAIIYTYPPVTNPDGTELVVVSDTKNQNATRLMSINQIAGLVPSGAGGTVTSVTLDFDPLTTGDTGLRLAGGITSQTITGVGTFDVGGKLFATHGGTGQDAYDQGDMLYYDATPATLEILTIASAPIGNGDVLTIAGGLPTWATPATGMSSWILTGDTGSETITDGETVDIEGGTDITTAAVVANKVTVTHDANARTETTVTPAQLAHGATFDAITSVTTTATGHLTADTLTTYQLPAGGGGGVVEAEGIFTPILVTQGLDGAGTLEDLDGSLPFFAYVQQWGRYYIINKQVYIDFYVSFELGNEPPLAQNTLGVSAYDVTGTTPATNVLGLQAIDALAADLNQTTTNNAGVDITETFAYGGDPDKTGWDHAPQGGKLNKFYGHGVTSNKSVAWFHWLQQPIVGGPITTNWNVTEGTWFNNDTTEGLLKVCVVAGSLNPITIAL